MAEHWCQTHKTKFFKTAKMASYAHPIKDAGGVLISWCNEDAQEVAKLEPKQPESPPPQEGEPPKQEMKSRSEEIETNMWWKIASEMMGNEPLIAYVGENFKSGKPFRKAVTLAIITKMLSVLPIKVEIREP